MYYSRVFGAASCSAVLKQDRDSILLDIIGPVLSVSQAIFYSMHVKTICDRACY